MTRPALRFEGQGWTYDALDAWIAAEAEELSTLGVGPGDRVAVLALNHPRTLVLLFACARLGAMLCPLNWRLAGPELAWILDDADPALLFVDGTAAVPERPGTRVLPLLVRHDRARPGHPRRAPERWPDDGSETLSTTGTACSSGTAWITGTEPGDDVHRVALSLPEPTRDLLLVYTSGTTGRPKGAVLTTAALRANAELSRHMHDLTAADHVLTVLPLFHVGGLNIQTVPALLHGATVTLHPRFDPAATLGSIAHDRPTLTVLVPATLQAVTAHPAWPTTDLSSLRAVATGSTVVQPAITAPVLARGVPVLQVYGSTETAPIAIYTPAGHAHRPESTGHPGPDCAAIAADESGRALPPGTPGEILLQGPQLFHRYWRNPAATAEAFAGPWFRTGDIGTLTEDGWVVHDRRKNLIVSGGENIYPAEIERVLHEMPEVAEAAVIAAPDPRWQEVPEAYVVLRPGASCGEAEVVAHVHAELARFKAPRRVHFVASLPRNAMGKVQHALLRPPA